MYVITAAHCVFERVDGAPVFQNEPRNYKVEIGVQDTSKTYREKTFNIKSIIIHPNYKQLDDTRGISMVRQAGHDHDIALIKLRKPVEWTEYAQPICLPDNSINGPDPEHYEGEDGTLVGWGSDKWGGKPTHELFKATMPIVSNSECNEKLNSLQKLIEIKQGHLCAGHKQGTIDGCHVSMCIFRFQLELSFVVEAS